MGFRENGRLFESSGSEFDSIWEKILIQVGYHPIEFSVYRFDESISLPEKFNKLYDMFLKLEMNQQSIIKLLEAFLKEFEENLYHTVDEILNKWLKDGVFDDLITKLIAKKLGGWVILSEFEYLVDKGCDDELEEKDWCWSGALEYAIEKFKYVLVDIRDFKLCRPVVVKQTDVKIQGLNLRLSHLWTDEDIPLFINENFDVAYFDITDLRLSYQAKEKGGVLVPSTYHAIEIHGLKRNDENNVVYTGNRYGLLKNLLINGFDGGFMGSGFWTVEFNRFRTQKCTYGITLGNTVNNIIMDNVILLDGKTALRCSPTIGGIGFPTVQLTSIHIIHSDIENMSGFALDLIGIEKLTLQKTHFEKCLTIMKVDSVSGLSIDNNRFAYLKQLMIVSKTYTSNVYDGLTTIKENNFRIASDEDLGLIHSELEMSPIFENNTINNTGKGKIYAFANDGFSLESKKNIYYTNKSYNLPLLISSNLLLREFKIDKSHDIFKQEKWVRGRLVCTKGGKASSGTEVKVFKNDTIEMFGGFINPKDYNSGDVIELGRRYEKLFEAILVDGDKITIKHTNSLGSDQIEFKIEFYNINNMNQALLFDKKFLG